MNNRISRAIVGLIIIGLVVYWQMGITQYGKGYTASTLAKDVYAAEQDGTAMEFLEGKIEKHFDVISFKLNDSQKILRIKINNEGNKATDSDSGTNAYTRYIYKYGGLLLATSDKLKYVEWQTVGGDKPETRTCTLKTYNHLSHVYVKDYIKKYGKSAKGLEELMDKADEMQKIK